jgi:hypothetical protein
LRQARVKATRRPSVGRACPAPTGTLGYVSSTCRASPRRENISDMQTWRNPIRRRRSARRGQASGRDSAPRHAASPPSRVQPPASAQNQVWREIRHIASTQAPSAVLQARITMRRCATSPKSRQTPRPS